MSNLPDTDEGATLGPLAHAGAPRNIVRGAGAATASQVWRLVVTLATHMLLRRLIPPAEMGVWNWAEPVFILLAQARDLGVPGHMVRQTRRAYGDFLRLEIGWGGLFALGLAVAAPILALGFESHDEQTTAILRALCLFLFVQGLGAVPLTFFEAEQRLTATIPAELARNIVFAVLSIALALRGHGVWSLVIAHLAGAALYSAMLWFAARRDLSLDSEPGALRALVTASLPLALLSFLELSVLHLDVLVLGLVLPEAAVARAALAIFALFFVSRLLADAVGRAVYPALVSLTHTGGNAYEVYSLATLLLLTFVVPLAFGLHLNAELVAWILGGEEWVGAADYLRVAAFVPLIRPLTMFGREYLLVVHRDRLLIVYTLLNLVSLGGLGYTLVHTELRELGMAVAGYFPLGALVLAWGLAQIDRAAFRRLLRQIAVLYLLAAPLFAPVWLLSPAATAPRLLASLLAATIYLAIVWRLHGPRYRVFWSGALQHPSASDAAERGERER
ncbi:MAG: hypothetical protein DWQ36_12460 [Acidobacteria bacterium]|nr:MAG: hypothetical protein DWQ30_24855 [Acidobacteriota bacterium]REK07350.1 MAG: hypothetical protein DWQ36_12460 [Acidobacteriota bacterium]